MFPNSWEHTNRCLIKSTNYMLIRSDIKGLATSWAWERISASLHRSTLTRTHNPCPHCLWSFPPCDMTLPCVSWFYWASALTQPPILAFSSCRSMKCPWEGQSSAAECGQPPLSLIPAIIMGSKGPSQSPVFQLGIPLLYWAACIWSLSPTEKLPPLSQEPPQHPILSAHKRAQKPVLHVVAIYYRRGLQERQYWLQKGWLIS